MLHKQVFCKELQTYDGKHQDNFQIQYGSCHTGHNIPYHLRRSAGKGLYQRPTYSSVRSAFPENHLYHHTLCFCYNDHHYNVPVHRQKTAASAAVPAEKRRSGYSVYDSYEPSCGCKRHCLGHTYRRYRRYAVCYPAVYPILEASQSRAGKQNLI